MDDPTMTQANVSQDQIDGQQPSSPLCHVLRSNTTVVIASQSQLQQSSPPACTTHFPLPPSDITTPPFNSLPGEQTLNLGRIADGILALSNYRLYLKTGDNNYNIPLGLVEQCEIRDILYMHIACKDARSVRCTFINGEQSLEWLKHSQKAIEPPHKLQDIFAFKFFTAVEREKVENTRKRLIDEARYSPDEIFKSEVTRLGFDTHAAWRISQVNVCYKLCPSYPPLLLVPACITDETLETVAKFRSSRRIPAAVWRHTGNGAVIARCSQPEVGWLGWRSTEDEDLMQAMADACNFDQGPCSMFDVHMDPKPSLQLTSTQPNSIEENMTNGNTDISHKKKVLIMDARSYTAAVANRARGGGFEYSEYYKSCEIEFMNLENIHRIRKSFYAVRQLCASPADQPNWYSLLENTRWLHHMSVLMTAACRLAEVVENEGRPVLVHCSDGWDRTPQIVALGQLLLDPYYRTIEGFRVLCEREWLDFGHKFADRCGHTVEKKDCNEWCPVFLQWLDCVHQLVVQFPCCFEFSQTYLVKLAQHTYSNLFGNFLCNTKQERVTEKISDSTFSVWPFLNYSSFKNNLYTKPQSDKDKVLWPSCYVRDLQLWSEVYLGSLEVSASTEMSALRSACLVTPLLTDTAASNSGGTSPSSSTMTKTKSYNDLKDATETNLGQQRRSSDPSLGIDTVKISNISISDDNSVDENDEPLSSVIMPSVLIDHSETPSPVPSNGHANEIITDKNIDMLSMKLSGVIDNGHDYNLEMNGKLEINGNGILATDDSDNEDTTDPTSDVTLCASPIVSSSSSAVVNGSSIDTQQTLQTMPKMNGTLINKQSVDTSTETLVAENGIISNATDGIDINEENQAEVTSNTESNGSCKVCDYSRKFVDKYGPTYSASTSGKNSRYSTPPLYSRPPSQPVTPLATPVSQPTLQHVECRNDVQTQGPSDVDGMVPLHCSIQNRLEEIIAEHKHKEEALERELYTTRMALIRQVCHRCSNGDPDRHDETGITVSRDAVEQLTFDVVFRGSSSNKLSRSLPPRVIHVEESCSSGCTSCSHIETHNNVCSLGGSVCSGGDGRTSANESAPSDMSWEALEEPQLSATALETPTLWVPDHAVTRCTGCHTEFWLGRRKHHCRSCGKIFCADCSENSTPLPNEQLYNPVRVCTSCFAQLKRGIIPPMMSGAAMTSSVTSLTASAAETPPPPPPPSQGGPLPLEHCKHNAQNTHQSKPVVTAASN